MKHIKIKLTELEGNKGQIVGLPENPRDWTPDDVENLKNSIEETPELLEARPMIVYPNNGKYVILGGNMRFEALKKMKAKDADCMVFEDMPVKKLKEIVMKDNSSFGEFDPDELANNWDDLPLADYGVDIAGLADNLEYEGSNKEIDANAFSEDMTMKFHLMDEEFNYIKDLFKDKDPKTTILNILGYGKN